MIMLQILVFVSGMTVLGCELTASRLLAPYFGTSLFIWANVIGLILLYLTAGYWLGGLLSDRLPVRAALYHVCAFAAIFIGVVPYLAKPILYFSSLGFASVSLGMFWGSLLGVVGLFLIPLTLLGCVSPWTVRLAVVDVAGAGKTAGRLYAISTLGSLVGAYLPVLFLIPTVGTDRTFVLLSALLLITSLVGLAQERRAGITGEGPWVAPIRDWTPRLFVAYIVCLAAILAMGVLPRGIVRAQPYGQLLWEGESAYNYIQVVKQGTRTDLVLNEGHAIHSIYDPTAFLTGGPWDYFMVAPYFSPGTRMKDVDSFLLLGSAAGTTPRQMTQVYGPIPIDGVEIDPAIIDVGRQYFGMTMPNLAAIPQDGRYFLRNTPKQYRMIGVDAYRQPYIPFHMVTREFFTEMREHLKPGGVAVINVGRTQTDYRLVNVLASTMRDVYPTVFVINIPKAINSIVVGTREPGSLDAFRANIAALDRPELREVGALASTTMCEYVPPGQTSVSGGEPCAFAKALPRQVFTDDLAPVEQVVDQILLGYIQEHN